MRTLAVRVEETIVERINAIGVAYSYRDNFLLQPSAVTRRLLLRAIEETEVELGIAKKPVTPAGPKPRARKGG
jgi:hypothetical protein